MATFQIPLFRKEHSKFTQIYTIPTDGGEAVPLTSHSGVSSYSWSPNGRWIAFISKDKISIEEQKEEQKVTI